MKSIISISLLLFVVIFSFSISESFMPDVLAADSKCKKIEKDTGLTCEQQRIDSMLAGYIELIDNDDNRTLGEKLQEKSNLKQLISLNANTKNPYAEKSTVQTFRDFENFLKNTSLTNSDVKRIETIWFDNTLCNNLSETRCNLLKQEILQDNVTMSELLKIVFNDVISKPSDENSALSQKDCDSSLSFKLDKQKYSLGDNIIISGNVSNIYDDFITLNIINLETNTLSYIGQYTPDNEGNFNDVIKTGTTFGGGELHNHNSIPNNKMFTGFFI